MLLRHLPRDSSYLEAVVGPSARWSDAEYLLAQIVDGVQVSNYLAKVGFRLTGEHRPPEPLARPGTVRRRVGNSMTPAELRKRLGMKDR